MIIGCLSVKPRRQKQEIIHQNRGYPAVRTGVLSSRWSCRALFSERGSMSRSTSETGNGLGLFERQFVAKPLRVTGPRSNGSIADVEVVV